MPRTQEWWPQYHSIKEKPKKPVRERSVSCCGVSIAIYKSNMISPPFSISFYCYQADLAGNYWLGYFGMGFHLPGAVWNQVRETEALETRRRVTILEVKSNHMLIFVSLASFLGYKWWWWFSPETRGLWSPTELLQCVSGPARLYQGRNEGVLDIWRFWCVSDNHCGVGGCFECLKEAVYFIGGLFPNGSFRGNHGTLFNSWMYI